jgi:hypothetical protein
MEKINNKTEEIYNTFLNIGYAQNNDYSFKLRLIQFFKDNGFRIKFNCPFKYNSVMVKEKYILNITLNNSDKTVWKDIDWWKENIKKFEQKTIDSKSKVKNTTLDEQLKKLNQK